MDTSASLSDSDDEMVGDFIYGMSHTARVRAAAAEEAWRRKAEEEEADKAKEEATAVATPDHQTSCDQFADGQNSSPMKEIPLLCGLVGASGHRGLLKINDFASCDIDQLATTAAVANEAKEDKVCLQTHHSRCVIQGTAASHRTIVPSNFITVKNPQDNITKKHRMHLAIQQKLEQLVNARVGWDEIINHKTGGAPSVQDQKVEELPAKSDSASILPESPTASPDGQINKEGKAMSTLKDVQWQALDVANEGGIEQLFRERAESNKIIPHREEHSTSPRRQNVEDLPVKGVKLSTSTESCAMAKQNSIGFAGENHNEGEAMTNPKEMKIKPNLPYYHHNKKLGWLNLGMENLPGRENETREEIKKNSEIPMSFHAIRRKQLMENCRTPAQGQGHHNKGAYCGFGASGQMLFCEDGRSRRKEPRAAKMDLEDHPTRQVEKLVQYPTSPIQGDCNKEGNCKSGAGVEMLLLTDDGRIGGTKWTATKMPEESAMPAQVTSPFLESNTSLTVSIPAFANCPMIPRSEKISKERAAGGSDREGSIQHNAWMQRFRDLEAFKFKHRHTNVPQKYNDNPGLGSWVRRQRRFMRKREDKNQASKEPLNNHSNVQLRFGERMKMLKSIGLNSSISPGLGQAHRAKWEDQFALLLRYREAYGHCDVPTIFTNQEYRSLGQWVSTQRRNCRQFCAGERGGEELRKRFRRLTDAGFNFVVGSGRCKWTAAHR